MGYTYAVDIDDSSECAFNKQLIFLFSVVYTTTNFHNFAGVRYNIKKVQNPSCSVKVLYSSLLYELSSACWLYKIYRRD